MCQLEVRNVGSKKAPPVRLYDRDLVETFIKNHAAELQRWQQRYRRNA